MAYLIVWPSKKEVAWNHEGDRGSISSVQSSLKSSPLRVTIVEIIVYLLLFSFDKTSCFLT